jgi:threonine dehydratase
MIEEAAALAIAACVNQGGNYTAKNGVVVICGANISIKSLKAIL